MWYNTLAKQFHKNVCYGENILGKGVFSLLLVSVIHGFEIV